MSGRKQPEYQLLPRERYSDGLESEEETFFTSPSLSPTISKPSKRPWDWLTRTKGFLPVCVAVSLFFVLVIIVFLAAAVLSQGSPAMSFNVSDTNGDEVDDSYGNVFASYSKELSWSKNFNSSSEFSLLVHDINGDGTPDFIIDSTKLRMGQDNYLLCPGKPNVCQIDLGFFPCRTQLLALDGSNGSIVWEKWVEFSAFTANCKHDLNLDKVPDCTVFGKFGLLAAINPVDGSFIWVVDSALTFPMYSYYSPLFIRDFDRDNVTDLIVTHGGDSMYDQLTQEKGWSPGFIFAISGRTGQQISDRIPMPDGHETYSSPVAYNISGIVEVVLFGSGGETVSGTLWAISLSSLEVHVAAWTPKREAKYRVNKVYFDPKCLSSADIDSMRPEKLVKDTFKYLESPEDWMNLCSVYSKDSQVMWNPYHLCVYEFVIGTKTGIMQPPVIVDFNGDNVNDLLVSQFSGHTITIDGASVSVEWDYTYRDVQSYSIPAPLHYNSDDKLDFLARFSKGSGVFSEYSYMAVIDGDNGELIWTLNCSLGATSSPLPVKSSKNGHDGMFFLATGCGNSIEEIQKRDFKTFNKTEDITIADDLWEVKNEADSFPDPWTQTRSFIQDYCNIPYDKMVTGVYYLTHNMIKSKYIRPIYEYKPYVHRPPSSEYLSHQKRDDTVSMSNEDIASRKSTRCAHVLLPWKVYSTPVIGDFDDDGRLDAAVSVEYDGLPTDSAYELTDAHPSNVSVMTFNIEDIVNDVFGQDIRKVVDFRSYYPADKQPWKGYMGSRGDSVYQRPNN